MAASAAASPSPVQKRAITPITVKGNAFWAGNERFYVRGVDYQPGGSAKAADPIADADGCKRDIAEFKKLGINTVRVYTVDNSANHDTCMGLLADAGIYLALDVNTPKYSLNRAQPQKSYNKVYLQSLFATVEMFAKYDNTLLFFSGNEVINDDKTTDCAPYVKAVTRDLKSYINARGLRQIPVGYSAADVESNRYEMAAYMNCGDNSTRSDFFAFNDYSWCDPSSFTTSGWDNKVKKFSNYSLPIFLSEFGCNTNKRTFEEIKTLYSSQMTSVYSGGLVYEYSQESSNYGLVEIDNGQVKELADFQALKSAYSGTPSPQGDGGYRASGSPSECPTQSSTWDVTLKADQLPAIPSGASDYFKNGAGKGPGLTGDGSQEAGSSESNIADAGNGAVTTGGVSPSGTSTPKKGAASSVRPMDFSLAPLVAGAVVLASSLFGGALIL
ncbi:glycoside hydrolase family 72 protein [Exserohilum turcica Et28A]|uniref:1,3-beta-glucanosyltransferase n=1 Tax=Exserohilum turcicum (strain 28A) TaxID=671987 RepID=R0J0Z1_EXST2|nr:glycoside hydrolase family 72 protein [Exserohilum turcica Et28A]EOA90441.1 glycoside hydrolase family 72 protein [Exserohilum turcica Et28A]